MTTETLADLLADLLELDMADGGPDVSIRPYGGADDGFVVRPGDRQFDVVVREHTRSTK